MDPHMVRRPVEALGFVARLVAQFWEHAISAGISDCDVLLVSSWGSEVIISIPKDACWFLGGVLLSPAIRGRLSPHKTVSLTTGCVSGLEGRLAGTARRRLRLRSSVRDTSLGRRPRRRYEVGRVGERVGLLKCPVETTDGAAALPPR